LNATVPGELTLILQDVDSGRTVFMRTSSSYSFKTADAGVRHFTVTADRAGAAGLQITTLTAAQARDGSIAITYDLSAPASVTAEIRNIAGRPVRGLVSDRDVTPGAQTLIWDARNNAGVKVPAGAYLLQLTAKTADGQTVRRICPINAAR
jgi:flagellar hook assembly protein FlgD